mmetsp:Transcript_5490/g.4680  ORF Transcript_5490/g.4680 Transcript_5490/m.4680 type:complete len:105 (-) Transcript_5490:379-693(-)
MLRKDSNKDWNSQISNIKNIIYKMEIKIKNLYFHRWHYKMKVDKGVEEVNNKQIIKKQKKLNKMKRWSYVLGVGVLNELMDKKRGIINKDVERAQLFSKFLRWK